MSKREVARPQAGAAGATEMDRRGAAEAAARWTVTQAEVGLVARLATRHATLAYEDLIARPAASVRRILTELDIPFEESWLDHIGSDSIALPSSHGLSGNPSRFAHGTVPLRHDLAWTTKMPASQRLTATAIAAPMLLAGRISRSGRASAAASSPVDGAATDSTARSWPPARGGRHGEWPLVTVILADAGPARAGPRDPRDHRRARTTRASWRSWSSTTRSRRTPAWPSSATEARAIRILENDRHSPGLAGARNTGLEHARGAFVATCDDDDLWHPDKLSRQIGYLMRAPRPAGRRLRHPAADAGGPDRRVARPLGPGLAETRCCATGSRSCTPRRW